MPIREILYVVVRRWYTTVVALLLAALFAVFLIDDSGTYSTRATVEFRWPGAARIETDNGFTNESVISFADIVARKVNDGREPAHYSQDAAPLYGAGQRESELVGVAFVGNQWVTDTPVAAIAVQVVGRSESAVHERQQELIDEVLRAADELQLDAGSTIAGLIVREVEPLSTQIIHITPNRLSQVAALGALTAAGLIGGVGAALVWDRWLKDRRRTARLGQKEV